MRSVAFVLAFCLCVVSPVEADEILTISTLDDLLRTVDTTTAATTGSVPITVIGASVSGGTGLAIDPTTGTLWGLLKIGGGGRRLATIDPGTGMATIVGNTGQDPGFGGGFAGITFDSTGTLYGITGDGGATPETLYTLDKTNASATLAKTLGNGDDGETIAFNPDDGLIYHWSGLVNAIMETIDPGNLAAAPVPVNQSGDPYIEALGAVYAGGGTFFLSDFVDLHTVTDSGVVTIIGALDHDAKGLVLLPAAPLANQPAGLFDSGFQDVAPTIHVFQNELLTVTTLIHLVPGDGTVTQAMLDVQAVQWAAEIDGVWNVGNTFQIEDDNGTQYDMFFDVQFVDQAFIDANGDALVTTVTVHETTPAGGVNTLNWALDQALYTASHEFGHMALGLLDAYAGASPTPQPPPAPDGLDDEALMGALVPVLREWYFVNVLDYFGGLGIDMVLAGLPPGGIPGGDVPDEGANAVTGNQGFTYLIPEPATIGLLALGLVVLARRRRR